MHFINYKFFLVFLILFHGGVILVYGQTEQAQLSNESEKCFQQTNLLSNESREATRFSARQMKRLATNKVLQRPAHFKGEGGFVVVKVLVNAEAKLNVLSRNSDILS